MENSEYNYLIRNHKLEELANIWNISDLTRYTYFNKYLLEYLLEKNIHTTRMDNHASTDKLWIKLYLKYNIREPLINAPLENLLVTDNNKLILDTLLCKLNREEKITLFKNMKKNSYWLYRINETQIINIYKKHGIKIPRVFIQLPLLSDKNVRVKSKLDGLFDEFIIAFHDIDKIILNTYINEFKRNSKINYNQTCNDISKLIKIKQDEPSFKLCLFEYFNDEEVSEGEYSSADNRIVINQTNHGIFSHELSHLLYDQLEYDDNSKYNRKYKRIKREVINDEVKKRIVNYLKDFHKRYEDMRELFKELYFANVNKKYGSYKNYFIKIANDLLLYKPEYITIDNNDTTIYFTDDNIKETVIELLAEEANLYISNLVYNYYTEELMLENLLDAILDGDIFEGEFDVKCLSGHSRESYNDESDLSLNECLADFYSIKNSPKANILTNKLRLIVGNRLVNFLEKYVAENRDCKEKILRK